MKTARSNWLAIFIIILYDYMKIGITSAHATKMKVFIFADLMNYLIIVENTQAQYFDNLTRNCMQVFSTMTIHSCIKFANINALFHAT